MRLFFMTINFSKVAELKEKLEEKYRSDHNFDKKWGFAPSLVQQLKNLSQQEMESEADYEKKANELIKKFYEKEKKDKEEQSRKEKEKIAQDKKKVEEKKEEVIKPIETESEVKRKKQLQNEALAHKAIKICLSRIFLEKEILEIIKKKDFDNAVAALSVWLGDRGEKEKAQENFLVNFLSKFLGIQVEKHLGILFPKEQLIIEEKQLQEKYESLKKSILGDLNQKNFEKKYRFINNTTNLSGLLNFQEILQTINSEKSYAGFSSGKPFLDMPRFLAIIKFIESNWAFLRKAGVKDFKGETLIELVTRVNGQLISLKNKKPFTIDNLQHVYDVYCSDLENRKGKINNYDTFNFPEDDPQTKEAKEKSLETYFQENKKRVGKKIPANEEKKEKTNLNQNNGIHLEDYGTSVEEQHQLLKNFEQKGIKKEDIAPKEKEIKNIEVIEVNEPKKIEQINKQEIPIKLNNETNIIEPSIEPEIKNDQVPEENKIETNPYENQMDSIDGKQKDTNAKSNWVSSLPFWFFMSLGVVLTLGAVATLICSFIFPEIAIPLIVMTAFFAVGALVSEIAGFTSDLARYKKNEGVFASIVGCFGGYKDKKYVKDYNEKNPDVWNKKVPPNKNSLKIKQ